jgi:hypothetical protein
MPLHLAHLPLGAIHWLIAKEHFFPRRPLQTLLYDLWVMDTGEGRVRVKLAVFRLHPAHRLFSPRKAGNNNAQFVQHIQRAGKDKLVKRVRAGRENSSDNEN